MLDDFGTREEKHAPGVASEARRRNKPYHLAGFALTYAPPPVSTPKGIALGALPELTGSVSKSS